MVLQLPPTTTTTLLHLHYFIYLQRTLKLSAFIEKDVKKNQRFYLNTATNAATNIATAQVKDIEVKLL